MIKPTPRTIEILKNFSTINSNLVVDEGSTLSTISEAKTILAIAKVDETFNQEFGIYDLQEFLAALGLIDNPTLNFEERSVQIKGDGASINYQYADRSILTGGKKRIDISSNDIELKITANHLQQIKRAAGVFGHTIVSINSNDGKINLSVVDPSNSSSNSYNLELGEHVGESIYDIQFLIANLKVIPGDYTVVISASSRGLISNWKNENSEVEYFIALEKSSSFKK